MKPLAVWLIHRKQLTRNVISIKARTLDILEHCWQHTEPCAVYSPPYHTNSKHKITEYILSLLNTEYMCRVLLADIMISISPKSNMRAEKYDLYTKLKNV